MANLDEKKMVTKQNNIFISIINAGKVDRTPRLAPQVAQSIVHTVAARNVNCDRPNVKGGSKTNSSGPDNLGAIEGILLARSPPG